jgi:hypothetical protein
MDTRTAAYLRERRRLTGEWTATARIVAGLLGAGLGALIPIPAASQVVRSIGGVVIVELGLWLYRFVWVAPKTMYFEALKQVDFGEKAHEKNDLTLVTTINGLLNDIARLKTEKQVVESQLHKKQTDQAFANLLTEQYTLGLNEIMNWSEFQKEPNHFTAADFAAWKERERLWTAGVRQLLEQHGCSPQVIAHFWSIHEFTYNQFHHYHHVSQVLSMFSERLKRLKAIINTYAEVKILTV